MKMHGYTVTLSYAAIIVSSAVLVAQVPAIAQSTVDMDKSMKLPTAAETTPMAPAVEPTLTAAPASPMPTMEKPESSLPALEAVPAPKANTPAVSTTSMPMTTGPAPAAMTQVLPQETITGIPTVSLPEPMPIRPAYFTLPIVLKVAQDSSATSTTPISDRYTGKANWNLEAWLAGVRGCMAAKPKLMRVVGDQSVPFMLNGQEGTIMVNSENRAVCPMS